MPIKIILTILFLSASYCFAQAQIAKVKGISAAGKDALYSPTALPTTTTVQTALKRHSDSLKIVFKWVVDQQKTIKILRDSVKLLSIPDTVKVTGNGRLKQIRKHYAELEIQ